MKKHWYLTALLSLVLAACSVNTAKFTPTEAARLELEQDQRDATNQRILGSYKAPDGKYLVIYRYEVQSSSEPDMVVFGRMTLMLRPPLRWEVVSREDIFQEKQQTHKELVFTNSYNDAGAYNVLYGQVLTDTMLTFEVVMDDGSILRDEDGDLSFAFFSTKGAYPDQLHVVDAQGNELQTIDPGTLEQAAIEALNGYFESLSEGRYRAAAEFSGGDYQPLVEQNPDVDPGDHVALLERACTVNGYRCMRGTSYELEKRTAQGEFVILVEFEDAQGNPYLRQGCCGADLLEGEVSRSEFRYTVFKGEDGRFLVRELPVYEP